MADRSLFLPATLTDPSASVSADHGDARRLVLEPRDAVRVRIRLLHARRAARRRESCGTCLAARLAPRRRDARRCAYRVRPQHRRRRARRGVRDEPVALPRRQRSARPADADALRHARGGNDARHVRLGRSGVVAPGRHRLLPDDVHAAEPRREQQLPGDAEAAARARAPRASGRSARPRPRVLDPARVARRRRDDRRERVRTSFGPLVVFVGTDSARRFEIDVADPKAPEPARLRLRLPSGQRLRQHPARNTAARRRPAHVDGHLAARAGRLRLVATLR